MRLFCSLNKTIKTIDNALVSKCRECSENKWNSMNIGNGRSTQAYAYICVCVSSVFVCFWLVFVPQLLAAFILSAVCISVCSLLPLCLLFCFSNPLVCVRARVCVAQRRAQESGPSGVELANVVWKELQSMLWSQWPLSWWETLQEKAPQVPQHPLSTAGSCCRSTLHSSCSAPSFAAGTEGKHQSPQVKHAIGLQQLDYMIHHHFYAAI